MFRRNSKTPLTVVAAFVLWVSVISGETQDSTRTDIFTGRVKTARIVRTTTPPVIDGKLDDLQWKLAEPITDFIQEAPVNLTEPTEKTEVRLLYDDHAIYISAYMYDREPEKIVKRLARRDDWMLGFEGVSDWFTIDFDSRYDHQTAFIFGVNAAGVQIDAMVFDDSDYDGDWDAVWTAEVNRDQRGWTAEIKIPFSVLRFSQSDHMVWGLNMGRYIHRKNEHITWVGEPWGVQGIASRYGILEGFEDVPPPMQLEIVPYFLSGKNKNKGVTLSEPDFLPDAYIDYNTLEKTLDTGLDIKYGLGSNTTLDVTVNPDFGQVEADPADINLTYFETYFVEKRPFFMENATIFETPIEMFYSRRIGSAGSRIISAGKISGKTAKGMSYGIITALTSDNRSGNWLDDLKEGGLAYYAAGRVVQDIFEGNSYIGILATHMNDTHFNSTTISADQYLSLAGNRINIDSQLAVSDKNDVLGWGYSGDYSYDNEKNLRVYLDVEYYDKNFDISDMGYNRRNDMQSFNAGFGIRKQDPWKIFRFMKFSAGGQYRENLDGLVLNKKVRMNVGFTFLNYWRTGFGLNRTFERFSDKTTYDYETGNLGPPVRQAETDGGYLYLRSDFTKPVAMNVSYGFGNSRIGDWGKFASLGLTLRPVHFFEFRLDYSKNRSFEKYRWLEIVTEEIDTLLGNFQQTLYKQHYLFAESRNRLQIFTLRMTAGISRNKSIEFYSEYFISENRFGKDSYTELKEPGSYPEATEYSAQVYGDEPSDEILLDPNYYVGFFPRYSSLNVNIVFRWEYIPGSTLFLVFTSSKGVNGKTFSSFSDFIRYDTPGEWVEYYRQNSVFLKLDYWFNMF